jgi:hypothetical protein
VLVITGAGRSGTSAVAKLVHAAGMAVGRDLIEADAGNPDGYYEERAVVELNERLLLDAGLGPRFSTASRAQVLDSARPLADAMRALAEDATPAWKDPRFCWTLEAWLPHFAAPPDIVICLRSPAEVVASTLRYYGLADDDAARSVEHLWRCQYERMEEVIGQYALRCATVEYAALHADTATAIEALAAFTGLALDAGNVRRDLRHHAEPVPPRLRDLYERIRGLGSVMPARGRPGGAP